jgi:superfamily II DNA/RNA helicase
VRSPVQSYIRLYRCVLTDLPSLFRRQRLVEILNSGQYASPIIVFVNQKKTADQVAKDLQRAQVMTLSCSLYNYRSLLCQWSAATLHSGKNQEQREAALQSLRDGKADVLVATDLAGRGIDVQDVSLVINFQMANTIEAYVHRIGTIVLFTWPLLVQMELMHRFFLLSFRSYGSCRETGHSDHVPHER